MTWNFINILKSNDPSNHWQIIIVTVVAFMTACFIVVVPPSSEFLRIRKALKNKAKVGSIDDDKIVLTPELASNSLGMFDAFNHEGDGGEGDVGGEGDDGDDGGGGESDKNGDGDGDQNGSGGVEIVGVEDGGNDIEGGGDDGGNDIEGSGDDGGDVRDDGNENKESIDEDSTKKVDEDANGSKEEGEMMLEQQRNNEKRENVKKC